MKYFITILISLNFIVFSFSQDLHNIQEFNVTNLKKDTWNDIHTKIGLSLKFDLGFKYPISDFIYNDYEIYVCLKDSNNKIVYQNDENYAKVYAKPDYKDKETALNENVYIFIPMSEINIKKGNHSLLLEINAKNSDKEFPVFYSDSIMYEMPKLYNYNEQEFKIENYTVSSTLRDGQKGIEINFDCYYEFVSQVIRDKGINSTKFYFYVTIIDEKNNIVFIPQQEISNYYKTEFEERTAISKDEKDEITLFISNRKLNLQEGEHNLKVILNVSNYSRNISFKDLADASVSITQESFFLVNMKVSDMEIKYFDNYDVSNVFGRIFSKSYKNKGRGYPDIIWNINTGYDRIYTSGIADNSFNGFDGEVSFKIIDSDPVFIDVYDYDKLSRNDFIASYKIKHGKGNFDVSFDKLSYKNIKNVDISFIKRKQPTILSKEIAIRSNKINGVSGIDVFFSYLTKYLSDSLVVTPFLTDNSDKQHNLSIFSEITETGLIQSSEFIINSDNGVLKIHLPYYSLFNGANIGFNIKVPDYNVQIASIINSEEIQIPKIKDIKLKILSINEYKHQGIYGVLCKTAYEIPNDYISNVGFGNINFVDTLTNKFFDISKITELVPEKDYKPTHEKNYFIPFYKLRDIKSKIDVSVNYNVIIKSSEISVGSGLENFIIEKPELLQISIASLSMKTNKNTCLYTKLRIDIVHGDNNNYKTREQEIIKNMSFENFDSFTAHPNDDVRINIIGIDKFGQEKGLANYQITANDIKNRSSIKLKKNRFLKKIKLNSKTK